MTDQPEKLDLRSHDIAAEKQASLRAAFPEAFTEGGKVDFDRLKLALGEMVDAGKERYGMSWPGKAECFRTIQQPSMATLVPAKEESVEWDTTENLIIEGDNLEVLKLLQKSYLGKVKMIYIDPPYNTGNDFIYPDNYAESLDTYLRYTGQVDSEGRKYSTNTEADGRFHSKWMNMMYPRLYLARNLLRDDGVIFISIGQNEISNLTAICNEIFGEEQRISICTRLQKTGGQKGKFFSPNTDYVVVYAKNLDAAHDFRDALSEDLINKVYTQIETSGERKGQRYRSMGLYQSSLDPLRGCTNQRYYIKCPDGTYAIPPGKTMPTVVEDGSGVKPQTQDDKVWRWTYKTYKEQSNNIEFKRTETSPLITPDGNQSEWNIYTKIWLDDRLEEGSLPLDMFDKFENRHSSQELTELDIPFDFAKPTDLVSYLAKICGSQDNDIILDFFAGSGTTGDSILKLNKSEEKRRRFILVQLPERLENKNFKTVSDITKERVRRVIKKLNDEDIGKLSLEEGSQQDRGFKVFKLQSSNFEAWDADVPKESAAVAQQLKMHVHHLVNGRTQEDILFEILLKSGFPLTTPIKELKLADLTVYSIADGAMLICLDKQLSAEVIKEMAALKPERVVCLDEGFAGNDQLKTNAVQTMKTKGVTSFRTV
jgi:adenine-specific DNA-methyltransferase